MKYGFNSNKFNNTESTYYNSLSFTKNHKNYKIQAQAPALVVFSVKLTDFAIVLFGFLFDKEYQLIDHRVCNAAQFPYH